MSLDPEDDLLAAEFALGTLDSGERAALAARRQREPDVDAAIADWERRLAPLAEAAPPVAPPSDRFAEIQARIFRDQPASVGGLEDANRTIQALRLRAQRWRAAAIAASGVAVLILAGFVAREMTRENGPHEFVAVLQKSSDAPAFQLTVNIDRREFTVRPVAAPAPAGKSYELWLIAPTLGAPRSLGVIDAAEVSHANRLRGFDAATLANATYAVTIEPPGGSPTGAPSGPPVFVGKLIPVDE